MLQYSIAIECGIQKVAGDLSAAVKEVGRNSHDMVEGAQRMAYNAGNESWLKGAWNNIKASIDRNDLLSSSITPALIGAGLGAIGGSFGKYKTVEEARRGRMSKILRGLAMGTLVGGAGGVGYNLLRKAIDR